MKKIIELFVNNSILVNFICVITLLLGIMSIMSIQKEAIPPVELDKVLVITSYTGASAIDMENLVTIPLEEKIGNTPNIDQIDSISSSGVSRILIDIDPDYPDTSEVVDEIYRNVGEVGDLPEQANDPRTIQFRARRRPVIRMVLYGGDDEKHLHVWARRLKDHLRPVEGVSSIELRGDRNPAFRIEVDPKKLERYSISLQEIMNITTKWNTSAPAGSVRVNSKHIKVRIDENLATVDKIKNLVVRSNESGVSIRIKDVAKVHEGFEESDRIFSFNGKKVIQVRVVRKETGDTIKTSNAVMKALEKFRKKMPGNIHLDVYRDDSHNIRSRLNSVSQNAILGLFFVVLMLLLFLNLRMALITAFGLPIAFMGSIFILEQMGLTFNNVTLIGIIMVLGMLVDDGIVVAENIFHHFHLKKKKTKDVISAATMEMARPVIGTVLTTIVAFTPLLFMKGIIGKFMFLVPVTVITCLTFSLIECFLILPNHAFDFLKSSNYKLGEVMSNALEKLYRPILGLSLRFRWIVAPLILIGALSFSFFYIKTFRMRMFPSHGVTRFNFSIEGPSTASLAKTQKMIRKAGLVVDQYKDMGIIGYLTSAGEISRRGETPREGDNLADFTVYLKYESELEHNPRDIVNRIRKKIQRTFPPEWKTSFEIGRHGPPIGKPVEVIIGHDNLDSLRRISAKVKTFVSGMDGVADVSDIFDEKYREYTITIDQKKATILGVELTTIQKVLQAAFEGISFTEVRKEDEEYKIIVTYPKEYRVGLENLLALKVKTQRSTYINLGKIINIDLHEGVNVARRLDQSRISLVTGNLKGRKANSYLINKEIEKYLEELEKEHPDAYFKLSGEESKRRETMADTLKLFGIAFIAIYMIMGLVFKSISWPFLILLIIPFSFVGALSALRIHGLIVDVGVMISLVGLTGIVVNDSIILISTIRNYLKETGNVLRSVERGALRRVRPICMTTVTTLGGLLPAAYEVLGKDAFLKPMALTIGWGLVFSTALTLIFLPSIMGCLYDLMPGRD